MSKIIKYQQVPRYTEDLDKVFSKHSVASTQGVQSCNRPGPSIRFDYPAVILRALRKKWSIEDTELLASVTLLVCYIVRFDFESVLRHRL